MTKLLRDNFAELYAESSKMLGLGKGRSLWSISAPTTAR
jgi:hypothetical protein